MLSLEWLLCFEHVVQCFFLYFIYFQHVSLLFSRIGLWSHTRSQTISMYMSRWNDIDSKVGEAEKANGIESTSSWLVISLEWWSVVVSVRQRPMLTCWFNWKKDSRFPRTTFSNSDENLHVIGLYGGHSKTKCASTALTQKWHRIHLEEESLQHVFTFEFSLRGDWWL
jgi:hypothetical protein